VGIAAALCPADADACSPPPGDGIQVGILANGETLHRDGAVLIYVTDFDLDATDAATDMTIVVTLDEQEVAGTVEVLDILGEASSWEHNALAVWRPDAEFVPAEDYHVTVAYEDVWEGGTIVAGGFFDVVDDVAPSLESITASVSEEIEPGHVLQPFGDRICCTREDSCGDYADCVTEQERETIRIRGDYDLGGAAGQYTLIRLFSGVDGAADERGLHVLPGEVLLDGYRATFNEVVGSYCVAFEAVDVLHGATVLSNVACVDAPDDLVLEEAPFDVETWAQGCIEDPFWEETGEPYGDDGETDGDTDSDTDGGSDSDSDGGDSGPDSGGGSDTDGDSGAGTESGGGPDSDSDTDGGVGASDGGGGCRVQSDDAPAAWALLAFLGLGGLLVRRRR